jgi:hypothetical protein
MSKFLYLGLAAAVLGAWLSLPQPGEAAPSVILDAPAQGLVHKVDAGCYYWRHHHRYACGTHVRAPFTDVDVDGSTDVEAPFTSVHVGRRGTWVRAPFVDIFVPR